MDIIEHPVDGVIDLHTFRPEEAASVVDEYLRACSEQHIHDVKIIHGKGKGALRSTVHALLSRHPLVADFTLDSGPSGWGATIVCLKKGTEGRSEETGGRRQETE
jgi:DNA-nicking Smr family endonuclease